jgi:hypothetical protein
MPTINPFVDDSVKASVFEEGFITGFMEPGASGFRMLASDSCSAAKQTRCVVLAALSPPGPARSGLTPDQSMPHRCPAQTRDVTGATRPPGHDREAVPTSALAWEEGRCLERRAGADRSGRPSSSNNRQPSRLLI